MSGSVWFITRHDSGEAVGSATKLNRIDGEDVADFRKRVKSEMPNLLRDYDANELKVCVLDDNNQERVLDEEEIVPAAASKARALIVIAPPLQPPAAAADDDTSELLGCFCFPCAPRASCRPRPRTLALCRCLVRVSAPRRVRATTQSPPDSRTLTHTQTSWSR